MKLILTWVIALIGALIAGTIANLIIIPSVDNMFIDKLYITISVSAILFPVVTFLCGLRMSPGHAGKRSGFILLAFVFLVGMLYISTSIISSHQQYILYYYLFYIIGCLIDLIIVLRMKPDEITNQIQAETQANNLK